MQESKQSVAKETKPSNRAQYVCLYLYLFGEIVEVRMKICYVFFMLDPMYDSEEMVFFILKIAFLYDLSRKIIFRISLFRPYPA